MSKQEAKLLKLLCQLRLWGTFDEACRRKPELKKVLREVDDLIGAYGQTAPDASEK